MTGVLREKEKITLFMTKKKKGDLVSSFGIDNSFQILFMRQLS